MVRIAAVAFLAFAASAFAAPQAGKPNDQILDFQGKPLAADKAEEFKKIDQQGDAKEKELEATFNEQQKKMQQELNDLDKKQREILGVPAQAKRDLTVRMTLDDDWE